MIRGLYPLLSEGVVPFEAMPGHAKTLAPLVSVMQVRVKSLGDGPRFQILRDVAAALDGWPGLLVVNDRADLAHLLARELRGSTKVGLHIGQTDLPPRAARAIVGPDVPIGFSTHDLAQLVASNDEPIDYVAFGPVFATTTKADPDPVVGLERLAAAARATTRPLVAIGGIDAARAPSVYAAGAASIAVASALFATADVAAAAGAFR